MTLNPFAQDWVPSGGWSPAGGWPQASQAESRSEAENQQQGDAAGTTAKDHDSHASCCIETSPFGGGNSVQPQSSELASTAPEPPSSNSLPCNPGNFSAVAAQPFSSYIANSTSSFAPDARLVSASSDAPTTRAPSSTKHVRKSSLTSLLARATDAPPRESTPDTTLENIVENEQLELDGADQVEVTEVGDHTIVQVTPQDGRPKMKVTPEDFEILRLVGQGAFGKVFQVCRCMLLLYGCFFPSHSLVFVLLGILAIAAEQFSILE